MITQMICLQLIVLFLKFILFCLTQFFSSFKLIVLLYSEKVLLYLYDTKLIPYNANHSRDVIFNENPRKTNHGQISSFCCSCSPLASDSLCSLAYSARLSLVVGPLRTSILWGQKNCEIVPASRNYAKCKRN